jgi:hypothetical protein
MRGRRDTHAARPLRVSPRPILRPEAEDARREAAMWRTGDRVPKPGVYSSECCSYEDALAETQEFPACGNCGQPARWLAFKGSEVVREGS